METSTGCRWEFFPETFLVIVQGHSTVAQNRIYLYEVNNICLALTFSEVKDPYPGPWDNSGLEFGWYLPSV